MSTSIILWIEGILLICIALKTIKTIGKIAFLVILLIAIVSLISGGVILV